MTAIIVDKAQMLRHLISPVVKIVVGKNSASQSFYIHENLLTSRSSFFQKALKTYSAQSDAGDAPQSDGAATSTSWREAITGTISLPEDEPETFSIYAHLLYTGSLPIQEEPTKPTSPVSIPGIPSGTQLTDVEWAVIHEQLALANLYIFTDKIQDIEAKCTIMTAMHESIHTEPSDGFSYSPSKPATLLIYNGTMPTDAMRKFLVDRAVATDGDAWMQQDTSLFHIEYLRDLAFALYVDRANWRVDVEPEFECVEGYCEQIRSSSKPMVCG